jgi:hypothetical protein
MITGAGFPTYPVVYIGGVGAYVASRNSVSLTVITPAGTAGSVVDVTVGDPTGRSVTMRNGFRYNAATPGTGAPTPGATPSAGTAPAPAPSGPATPPGATRRNALRLGEVTTRKGLRLAPVLDNLSPSMWAAQRCQTVLCRGVQI